MGMPDSAMIEPGLPVADLSRRLREAGRLAAL
jgi:hypothetical protein